MDEVKSKDNKYKSEHLTRTDYYNSDHLHIYSLQGGNDGSSLRGIRFDGKQRRTMLAVANTLKKGLWWKGVETGGLPKYFWWSKEDYSLNLFIGRLAFTFQTKRFSS